MKRSFILIPSSSSSDSDHWDIDDVGDAMAVTVAWDAQLVIVPEIFHQIVYWVGGRYFNMVATGLKHLPPSFKDLFPTDAVFPKHWSLKRIRRHLYIAVRTLCMIRQSCKALYRSIAGNFIPSLGRITGSVCAFVRRIEYRKRRTIFHWDSHYPEPPPTIWNDQENLTRLLAPMGAELMELRRLYDRTHTFQNQEKLWMEALQLRGREPTAWNEVDRLWRLIKLAKRRDDGVTLGHPFGFWRRKHNQVVLASEVVLMPRKIRRFVDKKSPFLKLMAVAGKVREPKWFWKRLVRIGPAKLKEAMTMNRATVKRRIALRLARELRF